MVLSEEMILSFLASLILPFMRVSSCVMAMFALGSRSVPSVVKLTLSLALAVIVYPLVPEMQNIPDIFSPGFFLLAGYQIIIGIMLGYATQFISQIFVVAGQVVAMQTGLGFASLVDPVSGSNTPVVGQFFTVLATILFFVVNGHLVLFRLLAESFVTLPVGFEGFFSIPYMEFARFGSLMFSLALSLSLSSICAMLLVNFTFGVMTRAAPQLNIFSLGFAVSLLCGLIVLRLVLSGFMRHWNEAMNRVFDLSCSLINTSCPGIF